MNLPAEFEKLSNKSVHRENFTLGRMQQRFFRECTELQNSMSKLKCISFSLKLEIRNTRQVRFTGRAPCHIVAITNGDRRQQLFEFQPAAAYVRRVSVASIHRTRMRTRTISKESAYPDDRFKHEAKEAVEETPPHSTPSCICLRKDSLPPVLAFRFRKEENMIKVTTLSMP